MHPHQAFQFLFFFFPFLFFFFFFFSSCIICTLLKEITTDLIYWFTGSDVLEERNVTKMDSVERQWPTEIQRVIFNVNILARRQPRSNELYLMWTNHSGSTEVWWDNSANLFGTLSLTMCDSCKYQVAFHYNSQVN